MDFEQYLTEFVKGPEVGHYYIDSSKNISPITKIDKDKVLVTRIPDQSHGGKWEYETSLKKLKQSKDKPRFGYKTGMVIWAD